VARQVVLLRGINLGSRNRVPMPALREQLEGAGLRDVRTYVQSGNVVLSSDASAPELAAQCEQVLADAFGLDVPVVVRTRRELAGVVKRDPLGKVAENPKLYQVTFLAQELEPERVEALAEVARPPERLVASGRELYAWHANGIARSKLAARIADARLGVVATTRNWTTVTTLLQMAQEEPG